MQISIRTRIIKIGNLQGICIPKTFLAQVGLGDEVELEVQPNQIVIRPTQPRRQGWAEQFKMMASQGDDYLHDEMTATKWDNKKWE